MPTDSLEFIDPIFLDEKNIEREFYVAGVRYYDYCNIEKTCEDLEVSINEYLVLENDSNNEYDKYTVKVKNNENKVLGFVPIFFRHLKENNKSELMRIFCARRSDITRA